MLSRRSFLGLVATGVTASIAKPHAGPALVADRRPSSAAATLPVDLVNHTSDTVYAAIYGLDPKREGALAFLRADGHTLFYPPSPTADLTPIGADVAIPLTGSTPFEVGIPKLVSGRIYVSIGTKLVFLLNPGPSVVQPSVNNPTDPNISTPWSFFEFTYDDSQLYANISFVDFTSVPISLALDTAQGMQHVSGLPPGGLDLISQRLDAQAATDGANWDKLVVRDSTGSVLRVLSPNQASTPGHDLFNGYLDEYINAAWNKYRTTDLTIQTQTTWGNATGRVASDGLLTFAGVGTFAKPSTYAVFNCSVPPFSTENNEMGNLSARLAAALNRTTLIANPSQPVGERLTTFYKNPTTNHYARIVHETAGDGLGYAFPYDDVHNATFDVQGRVASTTPSRLTVTVTSPT